MALGDSFRKAKGPPPLPDSARQGRHAAPPPLPKFVSNILDPVELEGFKNLLLFAESVVKGFFSGKHRSLDFGSNAEFSEYKAYQPGDPVAHVDWKVYARNRRLMIRKHRDEKEMTAYLVVDVSGSMAYHAGGRESKGMRAARIAAALACLMQRQGDKFSLTVFYKVLGAHLPAGSTRRHLMDCLSTLEYRLKRPAGTTEAAESLNLCAPLFRRRGSLIVISDFLTDLDKFFESISQFQHRGFDILLLHVVDPDETLLPNVSMAKFMDMETGQTIDATPDEIRTAYRRETELMMERMETECTRRGLAWHVLRTEDPWREALEAWLGLRERTRAPL